MKVCGAEVGGEQDDTVEGEEETGGLDGGRISPSPPATAKQKGSGAKQKGSAGKQRASTAKQKGSGGGEGDGCQLPP